MVTHSGGITNLRPPSTTDEAREWGRRGGIASGVARRRKASLRAELETLLTADECVVAKSIAVAICREAKNGNVGAFKAIAQVLGELREVIGVDADALPPPVVLPVHDVAYIEAERERQKRQSRRERRRAETGGGSKSSTSASQTSSHTTATPATTRTRWHRWPQAFHDSAS